MEMLALALLHPPLSVPPFPSNIYCKPKPLLQNPNNRVSCCSIRSRKMNSDPEDACPKTEYKPAIIDNLFLSLFRNKMVKEVGWDSEKPGYDGLIDVANRLVTKGGSNSDISDAAVRILKSLFPPLLLELYKMLIAPIGGGKVAAVMVARVTAFTCQWLMGICTVNDVELPDGTSYKSGVFVERCKYLEESKCVGVCINTCKLPTQTFFKDYMGVPLLMEPNFSDYSCQFKFGVPPPLPEHDSSLKEPCLEICPISGRRKQVRRQNDAVQCPKGCGTFPSRWKKLIGCWEHSNVEWCGQRRRSLFSTSGQ